MSYKCEDVNRYGHAMYDYCWQNKHQSKGTAHKVDPDTGLPACGRVRDLGSLEFTDHLPGEPHCKICFKGKDI